MPGLQIFKSNKYIYIFKISRRKSTEQKIGNLLEVRIHQKQHQQSSRARTCSHAIKQRKTNGIWEQRLLMIAVMRETRSRDKKHFK
jgi:hypothetical protein